MVLRIVLSAFLATVAGLFLSPQPATAQVYNVKIATDVRPDYSDMESMVRSITARWPTPREKCWAYITGTTSPAGRPPRWSSMATS